MTQPPNGSAGPPGSRTPTMPAVPPPGAPRAPVAPAPRAAVPPPPAGAPRRTAFAEGTERLRAAATTEPGRLRLIGAVLALLVVAFGAVGAWQMNDRADAADDVLHSSQPLTAASAAIYRSLADANTAASSGFLAGGQETKASRDLYERDIRTAAGKLVTAANSSEPGSSSAKTIEQLNTLLPQYKGLVERARANNRLGYPLGGAYLRYANDMMQNQMLPKAKSLYTSENERLRDDYADATPYPWAALALGVAAVAVLVWAQRRNYRRTNRLLNHGLVAATASAAVVLLWMAVGHTVARAGLDDSYDHGVRSLRVLDDARIAALSARSNENLTLVSRGADTVEVNGVDEDKYDVEFNASMKTLDQGLARAESLADDKAGAQPVKTATDDMQEWKRRHTQARDKDNDGDYQDALYLVIGGSDDPELKPTGDCFAGVDESLGAAVDHEQAEFERAAADGRDAMTGLPAGAAVLALLGAAGALLGVGRRLAEYR
ncbi:hypothetical protein [Streptomyces sp. NPDC008150]|uniref:hypothetical protein n=1 Tax=Streptomyces sp. NPDC008150 TaxID=3364816 RepID=UPI0036E33F8F